MVKQYELSSQLALDELKKRAPQKVASLSGAHYDESSQTLTLALCGRLLTFDWLGNTFHWQDDASNFDDLGIIPVLHYLVNAQGRPPSGQMLPYRDLWGAKAQSGPFIARPIALLEAQYSQAPQAVISKAESLGAEIIEKQGDAQIKIRFLPNIPLELILYGADDELSASVTILFDGIINEYLPTEDVVWVAEYLLGRLTEG